MQVSYIFTALEINKYIDRNVCVLYSNVYILHTQYIYNLNGGISTSGIAIHYIGWCCQSPNPQETHWFRWEFCFQFASFRFARLFQEFNHGVKWDLPVHYHIYPNIRPEFFLTSSPEKWGTAQQLHTKLKIFWIGTFLKYEDCEWCGKGAVMGHLIFR